MSRRLHAEEITVQLGDLPGWHSFEGALTVRYDAPEFGSAAALVSAVVEEAEHMDHHHPDVDIRSKRVRFTLTTRSAGGVTQADVELAHRVAHHAHLLGAVATADVPARVAIAVDTADPAVVEAFWRVGLALEPVGDAGGDGATSPELCDPQERVPTVWFQTMTVPRRERSRTHVDVYVPAAQARSRVEAVQRVGGRLVDDSHAPGWWVLADQEGNELCVCSA